MIIIQAIARTETSNLNENSFSLHINNNGVIILLILFYSLMNIKNRRL